MQEEDGSILGLATIRRNRGISLEQIADSTKISLRSLKAIEGGDFQKLPGGIYNTSYIRQYARAIDFDETTLLAFYQARTGMAPGSGNGAPRQNGKGLFGGGFRPASIAG
jgi:cytoskeletal protein RodZ